MKKYDDFEDDGRTIADMSGIERPSLFAFRSTRKRKDKESGESAQNPAENVQMTKSQNRAYMTGAILAGLAIVGVFIACGALVIFLMTLFWK